MANICWNSDSISGSVLSHVGTHGLMHAFQQSKEIGPSIMLYFKEDTEAWRNEETCS